MTRRSIAPIALLLLAVLAPAARADGPTIRALSPTLVAGDDFHWTLPLLITNPFPTGLYLDSLNLVVADLDSGATHPSRTTRTPLTFMVRMVRAVSGNDSAYVQYEGEASAEHARLTFEVQLHNATGTYRSATSVEALPGPTSLAHPSEFLTVGGHRVETVFLPADPDSGPAPGVLMVPEAGLSARHMMRAGQQLVARGYAVMLVSPPGSGLSEGAPDLAGPASVEAAGAALDQLEKRPGVNAKRIGAWGVGEGAAVVVQLARRRPDLHAAFAQSGTYDLWSVYRSADAASRQAMLAAAGSDSAGWRARSPVYGTGKVAARVLLLHGENDAQAPVAQARELAARLAKQGAKVELQTLPGASHTLSRSEAQRRALLFFRAELRQ